MELKFDAYHPVCSCCKKSCKQPFSFWSWQLPPQEFCGDFEPNIEPLFKVDEVSGVFKKIEDGVYEIFTSLTLKDLIIIAFNGYRTIVVTNKAIYELLNFGISLSEGEKVEKIFAVHDLKASEWWNKIVSEYPGRELHPADEALGFYDEDEEFYGEAEDDCFG